MVNRENLRWFIGAIGCLRMLHARQCDGVQGIVVHVRVSVSATGFCVQRSPIDWTCAMAKCMCQVDDTYSDRMLS